MQYTSTLRSFAHVSFCLILALALARPLVAQTARTRPDSAARKELQAALQAYRTGTILPTLQAMKARFDAQLSAKELADLNALRAQQNALQQALRDSLKANRPTDHARRPMHMAQGHRPTPPSFMKEFRQKEIALMKEVKPIASAHTSTLASIGESMKSKRNEWQEATENILADWRAKHNLPAPDTNHHGGWRKALRGKMMNRMGGGNPEQMQDLMKKFVAARFLLWDGKRVNTQNGSLPAPFDPQTPNDVLNIDNNSVFPNPAIQLAHVRFQLKESGPVSAKLYDVSGKEILTIVNNQTMNAGEQTLTVETDGIAPGNYLCRIQTGGKTITRKIVIAR